MTSFSFLSPPPITITCQKPTFSKKLPSSISCKANDVSESDQAPLKVDRRNVLLGLCGAAAAVSSDRPFAGANPILPPDLSKCKSRPDGLPKGIDAKCCPPVTPSAIDYCPRAPQRPRVRPAAHAAGPEYVAKYEEALRRMKALPDDDPRSFSQQAKIHCAYCNGGYDQISSPHFDIQVHNNWLFFPFHRWYLYFYERILGSLIGDPNFAIPFWNWDAPAGMTMPATFTANPSSPLYDEFRSKLHQPPYLLDLDYNYKDRASPDNAPKPDRDQIRENLGTMYRQMVSSSKLPSLFFGAENREGHPLNESPGTIENTPHTQIHVLTGSERSNATPYGEDMGNFYSAGRDPMFYAHHGNVDRMWNLWKEEIPSSKGMNKRKDISDPDWLDAAFLFYNENAQLVRVKVRDCVDTRKLGYVYDPVPIPWLSSRPTSKRGKEGKNKNMKKKDFKKSFASLVVREAMAAEAEESGKRISLSDFPITLGDSAVSVEVPRPKAGRSVAEKDEEEEVLVVEGIDFDRQVAVKFDVYVDDEEEGAVATAPDKSEYAGSFANVPHRMSNASGGPQKVALKLGISELLEDVGAEDDDTVIVTLVPRTRDPISIDGIKIVLLSS